MTDSAPPPEDLEARLSILEDDLDQLRNETRHARVETRGNSQRLAYLERIVQEVARIAISAERRALAADTKANAILEYLRDRNGGSSPPN